MNCYASDPTGRGSPFTPEITSLLPTELSKISHACSILCYVFRKPAGLINVFEAFSTFQCKPIVNVRDIVVVEEFRDQGISHFLLHEVQNMALEKKRCKITLDVLEWNIPAKSSYIKFGFKDYELDSTFGKAMFWEKKL